MKTKTLKGVSAMALLFGAAHAPAAFAQQTAQTVKTTTQAPPPAAAAPSTVDQTAAPAPAAAGDKVVITGSLIATTPEDAPKPVEVYSAQDLTEQGSPTVSEFVRSLSIQYGDDLGFGQSTPEVPTGSGFANANLRGLGSSGTLVLMNGRKTAAANGGFGADLNTVPMEALEAVEVLKDGASSTYGAGAVGGVINFRTRRDVKGPQITLGNRMYSGSDGKWSAQLLDGWVGDAGNILITLSHEHEDPMLMTKRQISSQPFNVNPAQYSLTPANPGRFQTSTGFLTNTPTVGQSTLTAINDYRTPSDCTALGGVITSVVQPGNTTTPGGCGFPQWWFQDLVSEDTNNRVYAEANANLSDSMEFHMDVSYSKNETFFQQIPIGAGLNRATDASVAANCTASCGYVIPVMVNTYTAPGLVGGVAPSGVPTATAFRNPFIDDFMARTGVTSALLPNDGALYTSNNWRPTLFGGNPAGDNGAGNGLRRERYLREQLIINGGTKGEFTEGSMFGFLNGIKYDYNAQYSQYRQENQNPDVSVARLQDALLGYGGAQCNAIDRVATDYTTAASFNRTVGIQSDTAPGTNGCQWFNPFASAFQTSIANHAANPQYNAGSIAGKANGYQNSKELWDWLYVDKTTEDTYESGTFDATYSGQFPDFVKLPGGNIGWAAGGEWRMIERRSFAANDKNPVEEALLTQNCPFPDPGVINSPPQPNQDPGQRGCGTQTLVGSGAFFASGVGNITVRNVPAYSDEQNTALFVEVQLPVLDNLNFNASARHEDFNGGNLSADIWSVAGKWDITDSIYMRGSYSTNFRAEAALDLDPNSVVFGQTTQSRFGNIQMQDNTFIANGIGPEDDSTINIGVGYQDQMMGGRLRASLDFWEININGQVLTTPVATVFNDVFGLNTAAAQANRGVAGIPNTAIASSSGQFANCGAHLISFVSFNTPCVTGVTTAANLTEVKQFTLNGPYFVTNGLDYSVDYVHPLFDGNFSASMTATENLVYKQGGYEVNGIVFDPGGHRLGYNNLTRTGSSSTRWRGNVSLRWANDTHNIGIRGNYDGGTVAEAFYVGGLTSISVTPAAVSTYGVFRQPQWTYDLTYIYTAPFWKDLELRASVINITDEDPPGLQVRSGYYNGTTDARGRIVELGLTKKF